MSAAPQTFWTTTAASSADVHWNTPAHIVALIAKMLKTIDLDPCSDGGNIPARTHYTGSPLDGLIEPWFGRAFINPPYSRALGDWAKKAVQEYEAERVTEMILLVPARVDTRWFRMLLGADTICFVYGRLKFGDQPAPAPFPSALIYFGQRADMFADVFAATGWIVRP